MNQPQNDVPLTNRCPECRQELLLTSQDGFDTWACQSGHGTGITLTEAWGHFQNDEIKRIWEIAQESKNTSELKSPALGLPMVSITVLVDKDEDEEVASSSQEVKIDVALEEQFLWFKTTNISEMPKDLKNVEPTKEELDKVEEISEEFIEGISEAAEARSDSQAFGIVGVFDDVFDKVDSTKSAKSFTSFMSKFRKKI